MDIGTLVVAKHDTAVCKTGEVGVCYEKYQLDGREGHGFIFEHGGYDGFSPEEVEQFLTIITTEGGALTHYSFTNVGKLMQDYRDGEFTACFQAAKELPLLAGFDDPDNKGHGYAVISLSNLDKSAFRKAINGVLHTTGEAPEDLFENKAMVQGILMGILLTLESKSIPAYLTDIEVNQRLVTVLDQVVKRFSEGDAKIGVTLKEKLSTH